MNPEPLAPRPTAPLAMWALTGALPDEAVLSQLDAYAAAGWGVVLYPRWGLTLDYLGSRYFERIRAIVAAAAERRLEVWLYDEFCWPSGQARGLVAAGGPACQARVLRVREDGQSRVDRLADTGSLLDRAATERFLAVTHEAYADAVGEFSGSTIRAVFTDEPSLPHQHRGKPPGADWAWEVPWSDALAERVGDLPGRLAAAGDPAAPESWAGYWAAYTEVFSATFIDPVADWCRSHGLAFTGHLLGEHSFGEQVRYNGSLRRQLGRLGIPGIDEISTRTAVDQCEALTLAAIAEYPGRERMVEVYALGPPTMSLTTMRDMVRLCAAVGVDRYVLAICPVDLRGGVTQREYLSISSPHQPWFAAAAGAYAELVAEAAETARAAAPLGVAWPSDEELWALAGPDPRRSAPLAELTERVKAEARAALADRLHPATPEPVPASARPLDAAWQFAPDGPNALRWDQPVLQVAAVPADAALSVQRELVSGLVLNGQRLDLAVAPDDDRFDRSFARLPVATLLCEGENRLELEGEGPLRLLPAVILWGSFGVADDGTVTAPPERVGLGDWRAQGYPMFWGTGVYRAEVELAEAPRAAWVETGGHSVGLRWNGVALGVRAWAPWRFELAGVATAGRNRVEVRVAGTLGHLLTPGEAPPVGLCSLRVS